MSPNVEMVGDVVKLRIHARTHGVAFCICGLEHPFVDQMIDCFGAIPKRFKTREGAIDALARSKPDRA